MIYVYEAGAWKALDTTVVGNKATAMVTHFSTFVLFAEKVAPTTAPTTAPTPTPTVTPPTVPPTVAPTTAPTATPTPTEPVPGFEAVFAMGGLLAIAYAVLRRKK